ncbi:hypothetical protein Rsub_04202 [Raphidocelis subcapitata]|uniref:Uncharacterized protein n=1 Tax=Raphidocelis subcapitata TaxID=307507 RepID=A0A2V0NXR3_9CHLO|nr:hypothetical protein Rsub_04202 [Raphidocelis subcapitata]|eukprot:GBF91462.1 hypothetical protein Rsub_04202 [Raphidocelis subcapitata]
MSLHTFRDNNFAYSGPVNKWVSHPMPAVGGGRLLLLKWVRTVEEVVEKGAGPRLPHLVPVGRDAQPLAPAAAEDDAAADAAAAAARAALTATAAAAPPSALQGAPSVSLQPSASAPQSTGITVTEEEPSAMDATATEATGGATEATEGATATATGDDAAGGGGYGGGGSGANGPSAAGDAAGAHLQQQPSASAPSFDSMDVDGGGGA